jgi:beta-glucanase (GH16 family)
MKLLTVLSAVSMLVSCATEAVVNLTQIEVYPIKAPIAGNYPQGLYKYPYQAITLKDEKFTQTLEWTPSVSKTFAVDTQYTAAITLDPVSGRHTFDGITLDGIKGLPSSGVESGGISIEYKDRSLVIKIKFEKTGLENAQRELVFSDDFDGDALDFNKWDLCPEWDRQGRSTWKDDMVSVSGGNLHLKFRRDSTLGKSKTSNSAMANNWIRAGAIRSRKKDGTILFDNSYGYYEARVKFPVVSGTWGAFWLMSPTQWMTSDEGVDGTEIDIVETIRNHQGEYNAALHWNGYGDNHKSTGSAESGGKRPVNIYDGDFHIFALDWSPSEYIFYVDGQEFWRVNGGSNFKNSGINQNMNYIKLTVESADWAGAIPADFNDSEMLVDYVRVYNRP